MRIWCIAIVLALCGVAAAEQPTTLVGRVTDVLGRPIAKARVYVLVGKHRVQATTNSEGRYEIAVPGGAHSVIIAVDKIHTYRQVLATDNTATVLDVQVEIDSSGGEVIQIVDKEPPAPHVPPKPNVDQRISLPYSDEAKARDAWARAWILLDVDERGIVSRLKLLKRPGFGLDQIAVDKAFELTFEPALDIKGKPMRTYILYTMEWPSWGWLVTGNGIASGRPNDHDAVVAVKRNDAGPKANTGGDGNVAVKAVAVDQADGRVGPTKAEQLVRLGGAFSGRSWFRPFSAGSTGSLATVPCAGSGPLNLDLQNRAYRDCTPPPGPAAADALPWITRASAKTALAELARTTPKRIPRPRGSRALEWSATGVTGSLVVALGISWQRFTHWSHKSVEAGKFSRPIEELQHAQNKLRTWEQRSLWLAGGALVSGAVTAFLWSRAQTFENFSVQPTQGGAAVSYGKPF